MKWPAGATLALLSLLSSAQDQDETARVRKRVNAYFEATDDAHRQEILKEFESSTLSFREFEAAVRAGPEYPEAKDDAGKTQTRKVKAGEYRVYVPEAYAPSKRYPLLIALHGTHGTPEDMMQRLLPMAKKAGDLFLACPSSAGLDWSSTTMVHRLIHEAIWDLVGAYAVDPDRVVLCGISMGGHGAFNLASRFPDLFAGINPRVGAPFHLSVKYEADKPPVKEFRFVENLCNMPIYWIVGDEDKMVPIDHVRAAKRRFDELKIPVEYKEYKGRGHEWFEEEDENVRAWCLKRQRALYPPRVVYVTDEEIFPGAFWVEVTKMKGQKLYTWKFPNIAGKVVEERKAFGSMIRIAAEKVNGKNRINVKTSNVEEYRLLLSDGLVDLDQELEVYTNGKRSFKGKVARSKEFLLREALRRHDRSMPFCAEVRVTVN